MVCSSSNPGTPYGAPLQTEATWDIMLPRPPAARASCILTMVRKPGHQWRAYVLRKSQCGAMQGSYGDQILPLGHFNF